MLDKNEFTKRLLESCAWGTPILAKEKLVESTEEKVEEAEEVSEHVCPLCESVLDEELSEEALMEHSAKMFEIFEEVNLLMEDTDEDEDEDSDDEDESDDDDDEE